MDRATPPSEKVDRQAMGTDQHSKVRTARTAKKCLDCHETIVPGSRYLDLALGLKNRAHYCLACGPFAAEGYPTVLGRLADEPLDTVTSMRILARATTRHRRDFETTRLELLERINELEDRVIQIEASPAVASDI